MFAARASGLAVGWGKSCGFYWRSETAFLQRTGATGFSDKPLSRTRLLQKLYEFVFQILFLSGYVFGLVFSRWACYLRVPGFSIPVFSPRDKRGIAGSGNRGLEIAIRADNGRFHCENFAP